MQVPARAAQGEVMADIGMVEHIDTSDPPFKAPDPVVIETSLPVPPSVNRIWRSKTGGKGVYKAPEYKAWLKQADMQATLDHVFRGRRRKISGPFAATVLINIDMARGDLDNRIKAVLDWAQDRELISNDRHCMKLTAEWVPASRAPAGCHLTLTELG
jgi:Holliday junction resolvase RusA-like endonuclease